MREKTLAVIDLNKISLQTDTKESKRSAAVIEMFLCVMIFLVDEQETKRKNGRILC